MSRLADKFAPRPASASVKGPAANQNRRPCLSLRIRTKTGRQWVIPYSWLVEAELSPDQAQLTIRFTHRQLTLTGQRLAQLLDGIESQTLGELAEADSEFSADETTPHITGIEAVTKGEMW